MRSAARVALFRSFVQIDEPSPKIESFAFSIASFKLPTRKIGSAGPKTSSVATRASSGTSTSSVGA